MNKNLLYGCITVLILMISCKSKIFPVQDKQNNYSDVDTTFISNLKNEKPIEIGPCKKIYLSKIRNFIITDSYDSDNFPLHCIINYAEKGDTSAQRVLYELSNSIGDNVLKFDYNNSSEIYRFLSQTLFITPKSNEWIPVLMKFAKDNTCEQDGSGHWPSGAHFGSYITGTIISNLTNKEYAKELGNYQSRILADEYLNSDNKSDGCEWEKRIHKIFMERLEKDYKDGKLNFE